MLDRRSHCKRAGLGLVELLVIIAIIALLIGLLLPVLQRVRASAARTQSLNNFKMIGIAVQTYHDVNNRMPDNGMDVNNPAANWNCWFQILPEIEQGKLYNEVIVLVAAEKATLPAVAVKAYLDPARGRRGYTTKGGKKVGTHDAYDGPNTDYCINTNSFGSQKVAMTMRAITVQAGTSNTLLMGEKAMDPANYDQRTSDNGDENIYSGGRGTGRNGTKLLQDAVGVKFANNWGSPYAAGCPFVWCDGSTRVIPYNYAHMSNLLDWKNKVVVPLP